MPRSSQSMPVLLWQSMHEQVQRTAIDYLALLSLIGCLSQTTISNESTTVPDVTLPTNFSVTSDQSSTDGITTQNQPQ